MYVDVVISPPTTTKPVVQKTSQATLELGSSFKQASKTASDI